MLQRLYVTFALCCLLTLPGRTDNSASIAIAAYASGLVAIMVSTTVPGIKPDYGVCDGAERKYCCAEGKDCLAVPKDTRYCEAHMKDTRLFCTNASQPGQPLTSDIRMNSSFNALTIGSTLLIGGLNALLWEHPIGLAAVFAVDLIFTRSIARILNKKPWLPVEPVLGPNS